MSDDDENIHVTRMALVFDIGLQKNMETKF